MVDDDKKKDPSEMTTDEALDYLFPPEAVEYLKAAANGNDQSNDESGNGDEG